MQHKFPSDKNLANKTAIHSQILAAGGMLPYLVSYKLTDVSEVFNDSIFRATSKSDHKFGKYVYSSVYIYIYLSTRFPRSAMKLFTMTVFPRPVSCIMTMHFCLSCLQRYGFLCYFLSAVTMPLAAGEVSLGLLVMQITGQGYRQNWIGRQTWSSVDFKCSLRLFQY